MLEGERTRILWTILLARSLPQLKKKVKEREEGSGHRSDGAKQ